MSITHAYEVIGMTCGHCVNAVTTEVSKLANVSDVDIRLHSGGASTMTITGDAPISRSELAAALEEAGDYTLVTA